MSTISISLVAWPRFWHRRECLSECVKRLRAYLTAPKREIKYVVSAESEGVDDDAEEWMEAFCSRNNITLHWQPSPPHLGANMNKSLEIGQPADYLLLCQDDMHLQHEYDLDPDCDFLDERVDFVIVRQGYTYTKFFDPIMECSGRKYREADRWSRYFYCDEPHLRRGHWQKEFRPYPGEGHHGSASLAVKDELVSSHWRIAAPAEKEHPTVSSTIFRHGGYPSSMPERFPKDWTPELGKLPGTPKPLFEG